MHKLNQITKKGSCVTENELYFVGRQPKLSTNLGLFFQGDRGTDGIPGALGEPGFLVSKPS